MAEKRKRRSDDEWAEILARWRASGLSVAQFVKGEGLIESTFYARARKPGQGRGATRKTKNRFAEVRVVGQGKPRGDGVIEIEARSGRTVRVQGHLDANLLRGVLAVVDAC